MPLDKLLNMTCKVVYDNGELSCNLCEEFIDVYEFARYTSDKKKQAVLIVKLKCWLNEQPASVEHKQCKN